MLASCLHGAFSSAASRVLPAAPSYPTSWLQKSLMPARSCRAAWPSGCFLPGDWQRKSGLQLSRGGPSASHLLHTTCKRAANTPPNKHPSLSACALPPLSYSMQCTHAPTRLPSLGTKRPQLKRGAAAHSPREDRCPRTTQCVWKQVRSTLE